MTFSWFLTNLVLKLVQTEPGTLGLVRGMVRVILRVRVRVLYFI